jgi:uncharacterized protein
LNDPAFLRRNMNGITVELRVHPHARRTALAMADGALKASVTAPPEDGKANAAVIALLSQEWRLPKSAFAVIKGAATRDKTIGVTGEPAALARSIDAWMQAHG